MSLDFEQLRQAYEEERSHDDLQPLPDTYYQEVREYIQSLMDARTECRDHREEEKLADLVKNCRTLYVDIKERRKAKILDMAAIADTTSSVSNLTAYERPLYDAIVKAIDTYNKLVLAGGWF